MSHTAIARNYAETLFELALREKAEERYGELLGALTATYRQEERFRLFLDTPRVPVGEKQEAIRQALGAEVPEMLLRFLFVLLEKRRQHALPEIEEAYRSLLDDRAGRVHVSVTLASRPDEDLQAEIMAGLAQALHRVVVTHYHLDPAILGGVRIRVGDRVMDGSLRRRLDDLASQLAQSSSMHTRERVTERNEGNGDDR